MPNDPSYAAVRLRLDDIALRLSIASLVVALVSTVIALVSTVIANRARKDAERIADRAHDEWAQQKWFDLYFLTNSAYDALDKFLADCNFQGNRLISIRGGGDYPTRSNEIIRMFREILMMATVFPKCPAIDTLCNAVAVKFEDAPVEMYSRRKQLQENLMNAMMDIRDNALVDSSVLKRVTK
jgi:hypothetical protein